MMSKQNAAPRKGPGDFHADPMMSSLQKSLIAETINHARQVASLNEPSRPFTPGDLPRHLFQGNDYTNRPGSAFKNNSGAEQAADEFARSQRTGTGGESRTTMSSSGIKNTASSSQLGTASQIDVLDIMNRAPMQKKASFGGLAPVIGKPIKPTAMPAIGTMPPKETAAQKALLI